MVKKKQLAWLAGLLEGEGTFWFRNSCAGMRLKMKDYDVVLRAHKIMGGWFDRDKYERRKNWSRLWFCEVSGEQALKAMKWILPFMGKRRSAKINEIIRSRKRWLAAAPARKIAARERLRVTWSIEKRKAHSQTLKNSWQQASPARKRRAINNIKRALRIRWQRA